MKRVAIATILILSLLSTPTFAAVKTGDKCTKVGKVVKSNGSEFKCVKIGKRLVWQKVKVVKPATPTPTPSPTPSPTPTSNSQSKSTYFNFKYESGKLYRKGNNESIWQVDGVGVTNGIDPVRVKAFNEIRSVVLPQTLTDVRLEITFGKNVPSESRPAYEALLNKSFRFWSSRLPKNSWAPVLVVTELDRDQIRPWLEPFVGADETAKRLEKSLDPYLPSERSRDFSAGGSVTGGSLKSNPNGSENFGFFNLGSRHIAEDLLMDNLAHEITHYYQFALTPNVPKQNFYDDPNNPGKLLEREIRMSCNYAEGGAVLFGTSILVENIAWFSDGMDVIARRIQRNLPALNLQTEADVISELKRSESWLGNNCESGYALGALAYEWLIADKGIDVYHQLTQAFTVTTNVDSAIRRASGYSRDEFYTKAAPYVLRAWKAANS